MNCPHCNRLLYSRLQPKCGFCGAELPPECRLSEDEAAMLREEMRLIDERRAAAKEKEEEEREEETKKRRRARRCAGPNFFGF